MFEELTRTFLKEQGFINILFTLVEALYVIFKKQPKTQKSEGLPNDSLLANQYDLTGRSLEPFFSDAEMKETQDVFSNFHQLFAETVLQISADIYKPDPATEKHPPLTHLDKWIPLLCSYISTKQTTFVKKQAKRLLLIICGNKRKYYQVRDHALFEKNFAKLTKLATKSANFKDELSYDENVKLVSSLAHLLENAWVRPLNWQAFVVKNG